jgi:hypothetical protein
MLGKDTRRILIAVAPDTVERVRRILSDHDLVIVNDIAAAKAALIQDAIRLIFVGARFDESRMFELLEYLRGDAEHKEIPIVAGIVGPTKLGEFAIAGLSHAVKIFGASVFVNLNDFPDDDAGNGRLRVIVDALILPDKDLAQVKDVLRASNGARS